MNISRVVTENMNDDKILENSYCGDQLEADIYIQNVVQLVNRLNTKQKHDDELVSCSLVQVILIMTLVVKF